MPARFDTAVQEAFYWAEKLDNGSNFADFGVICTPGIDAALSGLWRGRNKADNEAMDEAAAARNRREQAAKNKARYQGDD